MQDRNSGMYTYTLNNGAIHTNQEDGQVFIVFDGFGCDKEGFPLIPDSMSLILAIENYIKWMVFSVFLDLGKISSSSVDRAEQQYNWYIGKAQTEFQGFQNDDELESFLRDWKRQFSQDKNHRSRGMYRNIREQRYKR